MRTLQTSQIVESAKQIQQNVLEGDATLQLENQNTCNDKLVRNLKLINITHYTTPCKEDKLCNHLTKCMQKKLFGYSTCTHGKRSEDNMKEHVFCLTSAIYKKKYRK